MRLLTFSTLFPHEGRPNHGIFVENRLRHLVATGEASATVVAPVPWFPSRSTRFGEWARYAMAGSVEQRHGLTVHHPRYLLPPRVGMTMAPGSLFLAGSARLRRAPVEFDLVDGHYLYPDGVAAVALARAARRPVVLTARGSDITLYPRYRAPRRMLRWAMHHASALIAVSQGLADAMVALGAAPEKVTVLRNGVELELFRPEPDLALRASWRPAGPVLLSVGHLIARKRHELIIETLAALPGWTLVLVGEGPERARLQAAAARWGVTDRVVFAGAQPHADLPRFYASADVSVLASSREGWANVLLESMACGTPVVASNIPGNPEVITSPEAGVVVAENTAACFATTIARLWADRPSPSATRAYAEGFGWAPTSQGQLEIFRRVLARS